jgi:hypothetical protein
MIHRQSAQNLVMAADDQYCSVMIAQSAADLQSDWLAIAHRRSANVRPQAGRALTLRACSRVVLVTK